MKKKDIKSRKDIFLLVSTFYTKVRKDTMLAPFFEIIQDWDKHIQVLTTFWESNLFLKTKYLGDPLITHVKVDKVFNHSIKQEHFGLWLNLWLETIDNLFEGEYANRAKQKARKMTTFIYLEIFESRIKKD
ncbi:MAG: group III truncated hemoglobin [Flavobacteriaceae bacterium]|nr:group III truncated hemoglobin [Flavobacteriaceae bacterium]